MDCFFELLLGPLCLAGSLELGDSLGEVPNIVSNLCHELSQDLFDSVDLCHEIIGVDLHSLEGLALLVVEIGVQKSVLGNVVVIIRECILGVYLVASELEHGVK